MNLEQIGDRRERHLVKMMNSSISGNCHPAMKHLVHPKPDGALSVPQSRTALGKRRPLVIDATIFNQWSAFYRLRGIMNPISGLGTRSWKWTCLRELGKSTSSALDCANHMCQRKMLVNAVQLFCTERRKQQQQPILCRVRRETSVNFLSVSNMPLFVPLLKKPSFGKHACLFQLPAYFQLGHHFENSWMTVRSLHSASHFIMTELQSMLVSLSSTPFHCVQSVGCAVCPQHRHAMYTVQSVQSCGRVSSFREIQTN